MGVLFVDLLNPLAQLDCIPAFLVKNKIHNN